MTWNPHDDMGRGGPTKCIWSPNFEYNTKELSPLTFPNLRELPTSRRTRLAAVNLTCFSYRPHRVRRTCRCVGGQILNPFVITINPGLGVLIKASTWGGRGRESNPPNRQTNQRLEFNAQSPRVVILLAMF